LLADVGACRGDGRLRAWDVETAEELLSLSRTGSVLEWAPDSRTLITYGSRADARGTVFPDVIISREYEAVGARHVSAAFGDGHVQFWDVSRPTPTYCLNAPINSLLFNSDESRLGVNDTLWQVERTEGRHRLRRVFVDEKRDG
jgi:hypothetical protein